MAVAGWGAAGAQEPPAPAPQPPPQQEPAKETPPAPPAGEAPAVAPPAAPAEGATPAPEAPPRIIRVVCTDHICGNCDGKCHKNGGHVAVDKKGHCACTPTEGSALDRATRDAYAKSQPK
jgi:hypothetical protein